MGTSASSPESEGDQLSPLFNIPDDLVIEILIRVPAMDLVKNCVLVSRGMRTLIASPSLWRNKCEQEGKYFPHKMPVPADFKRLYFFSPYSRNLIRNPRALEGMKHWKILQQGGDRFRVEERRHGAMDINEFVSVEGPVKTWATSYSECEKVQKINLVDEGCETEVLDSGQLSIHVSEWYAARKDCASHYELEVTLYSDKKEKIDRFYFEDDVPQWCSGEWKKVEHTFRNKRGVRVIVFRHLGVDRQFWAGHYGSKFTLSSVTLDFS